MKKDKGLYYKIESDVDYIKYNIFNVSKCRRFPTNGETGHIDISPYCNLSDYYFVYELKKSDIGKYLNTWFIGDISTSIKHDCVIYDEMITLKKVNEKTSCHLYDRIYNCVSINICCPTGALFKFNEKNEKLYPMIARIHSIDDSSYGVWFKPKSIDELKIIRIDIMKWINSQKILDGDKFLQKCIELVADSDSIDYN